ncbi:unnamed protein product [Paramecium octaurelia]|uniref:Uncharacterized protein n=1 Tax=Paramecium octaurelia TaxID=43137 RepID=A0A8S1XNT3_PAROT|nr:unnamed protein product [Paramecium octaurelia]
MQMDTHWFIFYNVSCKLMIDMITHMKKEYEHYKNQNTNMQLIQFKKLQQLFTEIYFQWS